MARRLTVNPERPDPNAIAEAATLLQLGEVVAIPTETVYGLAANALDPDAVAGIFEAKGRPPTNPLIVHVLDEADARALAAEWTATASTLAEAFWPGPLTIVVKKTDAVPEVVTAGGDTVALRVPAHPIMQAILLCTGFPLAAPSANPSNRISATTADHVERGLGDCIQLILDGGPASGGLESTVVDVTSEVPRILRPGLITRDQLEAVLQTPVAIGAEKTAEATPLRSPGMLTRHYAPSVPLECISGSGRERVERLLADGEEVGWMSLESASLEHPDLEWIEMPRDPAEYASRLYSALHDLDHRGVDTIVVDMPPDEPEWYAVRDRLKRAAAS